MPDVHHTDRCRHPHTPDPHWCSQPAGHHTIQIQTLSHNLYHMVIYVIDLHQSDLPGQAMLPAWIGPGGRWPLLACPPVRCHLQRCCTCAPPPDSQPAPPTHTHTAPQVSTGALTCRIAATQQLLLLLPMACMQTYLPVTSVCQPARSLYLLTGCTCVLEAGAGTRQNFLGSILINYAICRTMQNLAEPLHNNPLGHFNQ